MAFYVELLMVGLCIGALYALIAVGYSLIYGALRFINFAHGEFVAVGAYCAYVAGSRLNLSWWWMLICGVVGAGILSVVVFRCVYRPIAHTSNQLLLVSSIGVSVILRNLLALAFGDEFKSIQPWFPLGTSALGSLRIPTGYIFIFISVPILTLAMWYLLAHTKFGLSVRAIASDMELARASGVSVPIVITGTFAIAGAYAGLAGVFAALIREATPQMGSSLGLKAFTAAVVGGIGSIPGSVVAGIGLGIVESLVTGIWGTRFRDAFVFGLLIAGLLIRPRAPDSSHEGRI
jgi:branched-chain amino acid transport system permease protein